MSSKNAKKREANYSARMRENTPKNTYLEKMAREKAEAAKQQEAAPEQTAQPVAESAAQTVEDTAGKAELQAGWQELETARRQLDQERQECNASRAAAQKEQDARQHALDVREEDLTRREQLQEIVEKGLEARKAALEQQFARLSQQQKDLQKQQEKHADELAATEKELLQRRADAEKDLAKFRSEKMEKIRTELMNKADENVEAYARKRREAVEAELTARRAEVENELTTKRAENDKTIAAACAAWEKQKEQEQEKLCKQENKLDDRKDELKKEKQTLLTELNEAIQKNNLLEHDLAVAKASVEAMEQLKKRLQKYEAFDQTWGGSPEELQRELDDLRDENDRLKDEIADRPSPDIVRQCEEKEKKIEDLDILCKELEVRAAMTEKNNAELERFRKSETDRKNQVLQAEMKVRQAELERDMAKKENETLQHKLERFLRPEVLQQDRDERIQALSIPYLTDIPAQLGAEGQPMGELEWLDNIEKKCGEYGFVFPQRLLYAFHTALKIADWSSITVLSGISGTGKSELPRLYALFGGINFCSVPVQPNWDSQESMLGYFNSIDNRFEATGLLRFLVQSTRWEPILDDNGNQVVKDGQAQWYNASEKPWPLGEYMSIVLLDEMNLAHVEHYFAEFLSKLESRRGLKMNDVPTIDVNLGAGCEPYKLYLRRNVLWVGTMNQDETTKTLSDKVLDRSIMINFPTPKKLESRREMKEFPDVRSDHMLEYWTWNEWCKTAESDNREYQKRINEYRSIVEQINEQMGRSGRAVGHRVWQSIEFYIANYPKVAAERKGETAETPMSGELRKAMDAAFEDQLVQKIMPKLRGIEDSGSGKEQLDEIWMILENAGFGDLQEDFDRARRYGYGEFFWNSAEYLEHETQSEAPSAEATADTQA